LFTNVLTDIDIWDNRYRSMGSHIVYSCIDIIDIDLWDNRYRYRSMG